MNEQIDVWRRSAVICIENCWCCYRDRHMFTIMKQAIKTAEHSLTPDILRKINPREAEILSDPVFKSKIRFRFSGEEFPPNIVFKVFIETNGRGIKYFCGKKTIRGSNEAARDSCGMMGNRKYLDQIISDLWEDKMYKVNDELDVSNMQEYMKYLAAIDDKSPMAGGKGNPWRTLTLEDLPRHHLIYDVVSYLQSNMTSSLFLKYMRTNNKLLHSQTQQLEYIQNLNNMLRKSSPPEEPRRRSKQALERVKKMKKLYKYGDTNNETDVVDGNTNDQNYGNETLHQNGEKLYDAVEIIHGDVDVDNESWDEEGKYLFEWTRTLSVDKLSR